MRWWPSIGLTAMLLLGWAVGRSSTPVDDWFQRFHHTPVEHLNLLAGPRLLISVALIVLIVAVAQRRWRLATMTVVAPLVGMAFVRVLKPIFGRTKEGGLAYPSGHITTTTVVMGMAVLCAYAAWWAVALATTVVALAAVGVGVSFHYFTDTIGGVLLGSAVVCTSAVVARRDLVRGPQRIRAVS
jgi:hypothetical protein